MKYSEKELFIIYEKRPDLIPKPHPSTNTAIIAFLKKYDMNDKPLKDNESLEWISLKQLALDHKDFPKFQTEHFNEVNEYNQKICKILNDPHTQLELDSIINKYAIPERIRHYEKPIYFEKKYQQDFKIRIKRIFYKINSLFWICFVCGLLIVLINLIL